MEESAVTVRRKEEDGLWGGDGRKEMTSLGSWPAAWLVVAVVT